MRSARAMPSATCCTARRRSSARTCRRRCAARSTTGSRRSGCRRDDRLRASIVVPMHSPELAAQEIERVAADPRFVQVLVWEMGEMPLGRRQHWPIYRAAERLDLPIGIHAGSSYRHPPTNLGWPSYYLEDYVSWSTGFRRRAEQPDLRRRVRRVPAPEGRADGIRRDLAARLDVARRQDLARRARRSAVAGEIARRLCARACAPDRPAVRRAAARRSVAAHHRGDRLRRDAAVRHRLSALAFRRQGCPAGRLARRADAEDPGRQRAEDYPRLSP